ncbi:hypothetical protein TIFTF001_006341 [Ficus carica]|uniref:Uncharacterized protein n=1 Tax=Ficus carica TaxID=3494 RepID=A0AA87ZIL8_FICCA|nr:hypothetical protein TIFTF001_006341 [Ficus carica]
MKRDTSPTVAKLKLPVPNIASPSQGVLGGVPARETSEDFRLKQLWAGRGANSNASFEGSQTPVVADQPRSLWGTSGTGNFGGLPAQATLGGRGVNSRASFGGPQTPVLAWVAD